MLYIVLMCPKCGKIQMMGTLQPVKNATLKCKMCQKSTKLYNNIRGGLRLKIFIYTDSPQTASMHVQRIIGYAKGILE